MEFFEQKLRPSLILFAPITSLLLVCSARPVRPDEPLATITVEAGNHRRVDTPVSVNLPAVSKQLLNDGAYLVQVQPPRGKRVPAQIEQGNPPKLWWIIAGNMPPAGLRIYKLYAGAMKTPDVRVIKNDSFLQLQIGGADVLRYNNAIVPAPTGKSKLYDRSGFIHPLWSPTGDVLTNIHPPDHIHHMGIWMPWTKTKFEGQEIDFWNLGKGQGTVRFVKFLSTTAGPVYAGFMAEHQHVALNTPSGEKVVLNEVWDVRVYNVGGPDKGYWLWDFVSTQRCATDSPLLLLKYRYGGLGFRGAKQWQGNNALYLTSEGKTRKNGHATRARWCDMAGAINGKWAGVTIFSHPQNFRHPEPMRIWPSGQVFFNFAPEQLGDWTLEPGKNYVFRYRFYVHEGKVHVPLAERIWNDYAQPPVIKLKKTNR